MNIKQEKINTGGIKLFMEDNGKKIAYAYLYFLKNDLHEQPFGFMEDVFVDENYRSQGLGTKLVEELIKVAKENNCYKLIGTSRYEREKVHSWYLSFGFKDRGKEFRMDF